MNNISAPVGKFAPRKSILKTVFQRNDAKKKTTSFNLAAFKKQPMIMNERKSAFQNLTSRFLKINSALRRKIVDIRKRAGTGSLSYLTERQVELLSEESSMGQQSQNYSIIHFETLTKFTVEIIFKFSGLWLRENFEKDLFRPTYKNLKKHLVNTYVFKNTSQAYSKIKSFLPFFMRKSSGLYKILWDAASVLMVMTTIFVFSISLFFGIPKATAYSFSNEATQIGDNSFKSFLVANMIFVLVNIYLGFHTPFYSNGELITDKFAIRKYYKRNYFLLDSLSLVPYFLYVIPQVDSEGDGRFILLRLVDALVFIRLRELYLFFQNFEAIISLNEKLEGFFELFKLICSVLLITHFVGCFWYLVGASGNDISKMSWIDRVSPGSRDWVDLYSQSIYWALTTIATVGYGDITPQSNRERFYSMLIMIVGSAIFGYSVNKIGSILDSLNQKKANLKKSIKIIDIYMKNLNIAYELQLRIKKYLEFSFLKESTFINKAQDIVLEKLNQSLKGELLEYAYGGFINSIPLFSKYFSSFTLKNLNRIIKTKNSSPGEILINQLSSERSLYFIVDGSFEVVYAKGDRVHKLRLNKGDFFGEFSFFTGFPPTRAIRSLAYSTIYCIEREDFLEALQQDKDDYYKYCEIRDKLTLKLDITPISKPCIFCGDKTHLIAECPSMFYRPNPLTVILKHLYSPFQKRSKAKRFSRRKKKPCLHALGNARNISQKNIDFRSAKNLDIVSSTSIDYPSDDNYEPIVEPTNLYDIVDRSPDAFYSSEDKRASISDIPLLPSPNFIDNVNHNSKEHKFKYESSLEQKIYSSLENFPEDSPPKQEKEITFKQDFLEGQGLKLELDKRDRLSPFPAAGKQHQMEILRLPSPMRVQKVVTQEQIEFRPLSENKVFSFEAFELGGLTGDAKKPTLGFTRSRKQRLATHKAERSNDKHRTLVSAQVNEDPKGSIYSRTDTFQGEVFKNHTETLGYQKGLRPYELFARDMDSMRSFNQYMVHNNVEVVVKSVKKARERKGLGSFVTQGSKRIPKNKFKITLDVPKN